MLSSTALFVQKQWTLYKNDRNDLKLRLKSPDAKHVLVVPDMKLSTKIEYMYLNSQISLSNEARKILTIRSQSRTPAMIKQVCFPYTSSPSLRSKVDEDWMKTFHGTARDDRIWELCFLNKLGDEYHYVLECTYFDDLRKLYLPRDYVHEAYKYYEMNSSDNQLLFKISKYCKVVLKTFQEIFKNI